jgi:chlorobactene glucosyltransferase
MTTSLIATALAATLLLVAMWLIALHNAQAFPRLTSANPPLHALPAVTILVPARNESANIGRVVTDILAQDVDDLHLFVLDDQSDDDTSELACAAAKGDPRFRLLEGDPLPPGWLGKSWACEQLARHATTELMLFSDADVRWRPGALRALLAHAVTTDADLTSVWPTQETVTWSERLVVPMMAFILLAYLPVRWAHSPLMVEAAAANGQVLLFRRRAYQAIGGHRSVAGNVLDDVGLALAIKRAQLRLRMVDGAGLVTCRMYHSCPEVVAGYGKNVVAGHGDSVLLLLTSMLVHLLLFVMPVIWLLVALTHGAWGQAMWAAALVALGTGLRALTAAGAGLRVRDAWWLPISILFFCAIGLYAVWDRVVHGGPKWKGRRIIVPQGPGYDRH